MIPAVIRVRLPFAAMELIPRTTVASQKRGLFIEIYAFPIKHLLFLDFYFLQKLKF